MHSALRIAATEFRMLVRSGPGLAVLTICMGAAIVVCGTAQLAPPVAGYRLSVLGNILLGFLVVPLMAQAAQRDTLSRSADIVRTRPYRLDVLVVARSLAASAGVLAIFALTVIAGVLARWLIAGGGLNLYMGWDAFWRCFTPLLFLSTLTYCFTWLMRNHLAATVVAALWLVILLGRDYVGRLLDFSLTQNAVIYWLLAAALIALIAAAARVREGAGRSARYAGLAAALAAVAAVWIACSLEMSRHDPPFRLDPMEIAMGGQNITGSHIAPGFWLPDQRGHIFRLSEHPAPALVVGFWSPRYPDSAVALEALKQIHERWGPNVQPVAICISNDISYGAGAAREMGLSFPSLTDPGSQVADTVQASAPILEAYDVVDLPTIIVADGKRRVVGTPIIQVSASTASTLTAVENRLVTVLPRPQGVAGQ